MPWRIAVAAPPMVALFDIAHPKRAVPLMLVDMSVRGDKDLISVDEYLNRHKS